MNKYHEVIYGNYPKSTYPGKFALYLHEKYFSNYLPYISTLANPFDEQPLTFLDLGCGDCTYVKLFEQLGYLACGVDKDFYTGFGFSKSNKRYKFDFETGTLPYNKETFDFVFTKSTIEHVRNTEHFLSEAKRVLKPGGKLLILCPAWEYNWRDFYNDYTHVKPFHRKGLQDALKIAGFRNVKVEYFYHLPWLWGRPARLPIALLLRLFSPWKWKNKEENIHRPNIRFSQEVQLLATAEQ